jgi:predicted RNase H-like HicB family nuclease
MRLVTRGTLVVRYNLRMPNEFTAILERDGRCYVAYCAEVPGANGQGRTKAAARRNLAEAIALILEDRRADVAARPAKGRNLRR